MAARARSYEKKDHRNWRSTSFNYGDTFLFVGLNGERVQNNRVTIDRAHIDGTIEIRQEMWAEGYGPNDPGRWVRIADSKVRLLDLMAMVEDHMLLELEGAESVKDPEG